MNEAIGDLMQASFSPLRWARLSLNFFYAMTILAVCLLGNRPLAAQTGTLAIDASASVLAAKSKTVTSPFFSTSSPNELLLAFVSADYLSGTNTTVTGVSGGGLTWALVLRTNAQSGTAEIWRAFTPSILTNASVTATLSQSVVSAITVLGFTGADATGTNARRDRGNERSEREDRGAHGHTEYHA